MQFVVNGRNCSVGNITIPELTCVPGKTFYPKHKGLLSLSNAGEQTHVCKVNCF